MKYAFIIGSNAFIVPHGVISATNGTDTKEILRINSFHRPNEATSHLSINVDIEDSNGNHIQINNNILQSQGDLQLTHDHDMIRVVRPDGGIVFNVQQLEAHEWEALEHNIVAELEISAPLAVIRVFGEFKTEGLHIMAENEKLFINDNGYATSAMHGTRELKFTANGVVLN
jgi:hypothetical protein